MISPMMSAAINVPVLEGTASALSLPDNAHSRAATSNCSTLISVTLATSRENSRLLSWLNLTILSLNSELPWDIWGREASFWLHYPSCSSLLGFLGILTAFGLIQFSHLATVVGDPGISVSQSRHRSEEETLGLPGRQEWGHLYRESSKRSGICSQHEPLPSEIILPLTALPNPERCCSRPRHRQVITAVIFQKSREQPQTQGPPLPLPVAFMQGVKPVC